MSGSPLGAEPWATAAVACGPVTQEPRYRGIAPICHPVVTYTYGTTPAKLTASCRPYHLCTGQPHSEGPVLLHCIAWAHSNSKFSFRLASRPSVSSFHSFQAPNMAGTPLNLPFIRTTYGPEQSNTPLATLLNGLCVKFIITAGFYYTTRWQPLIYSHWGSICLQATPSKPLQLGQTCTRRCLILNTQ